MPSEETVTEEEEEVTEAEESEQEEVDLEKYPVGQDKDALSTAVQEGMEQGAFGEVLSGYSPGEFNDLVNDFLTEYQTLQKRRFYLKIATLAVSIILVLSLFGGLLWFSLEQNQYGGALIFFAGTLAGYFMRLATEIA